jgi:hypothetical protein
MAAALVLLIFVPLIAVSVAATVWWVVVLVEAVKVPDQAWTAAGQDKLIFVLLMVFLGVIGTLVYVLVARPALRSVGAPV